MFKGIERQTIIPPLRTDAVIRTAQELQERGRLTFVGLSPIADNYHYQPNNNLSLIVAPADYKIVTDCATLDGLIDLTLEGRKPNYRIHSQNVVSGDFPGLTHGMARVDNVEGFIHTPSGPVHHDTGIRAKDHFVLHKIARAYKIPINDLVQSLYIRVFPHATLGMFAREYETALQNGIILKPNDNTLALINNLAMHHLDGAQLRALIENPYEFVQNLRERIGFFLGGITIAYYFFLSSLFSISSIVFPYPKMAD